MSDFSLFSLFTAGLACLVPFTAAYTQPVGAEPEGNPLYTPGLHTVVPVLTPYTITWNPTTTGTVTLVLLKGPSTNAVPLEPIIEKIPNTGSFIWVPQSNLQPTSGDTGYGIQLIDDATGQYQYTTQFGISNDNYQSSAGSPSGYGTSTSSSSSSSSSSTTAAPSGYAQPTTGIHSHGSNSTMTHSSGWMPHNTTMIKPTGHYTKPTHQTTSMAASTPSAPPPSSPAPASAASTGGASTLAASFVGLVFAAGVACLAL